MFESDQFSKERERLTKLDSLTVLDYIRTCIEILMQMKLDDDKDGAKETKLQGFGQGDNGTASEFTSTF
jgi:predicted RNase H-like nuclease (RuvC/YqgF family)